jgi:hypothetical protein
MLFVFFRHPENATQGNTAHEKGCGAKTERKKKKKSTNIREEIYSIQSISPPSGRRLCTFRRVFFSSFFLFPPLR